MSGQGWFGSKTQLDYVLASANADRDEDGKFLITGGVAVGLGGQDVCVAEDACCLIAGKPQSIAALLAATSYGTSVLVIC